MLAQIAHGLAPLVPPGAYNQYTGAASAFGFRNLFASWTGACCDVRRASDNATASIGLLNNEFDSVAFNTFIGASTGFVTKWHDQSGNGRHAVQATAVKQPQLLLNQINGKPALKFVAANATQLDAPGAATGTADHTMLVVARYTSHTSYTGLACYGDASAIGIASSDVWWQGGQYLVAYGTQTSVFADTLPHVFSKTASGPAGSRQSDLWIDAGHTGQNANPDYGNNLTSSLSFGVYVNGSGYCDALIGEALCYPNVTVSRAGVEAVAGRYFMTYDQSIPNSSSLTTWHVFAIAGQSNATGYGHSIDLSLDARDPNILQWGGGGLYQSTLINAFEPLAHPDFAATGIANNAGLVGFGLAFARAYKATQAASVGVILVPVAVGGTGFSTGNWNSGNPGNASYELAITQVNACLAAVSGSLLKGVLWHQGEADLAISGGASAYQTAFDALIDGFRARMTGGGATLPFVAGGMVPEWNASHTPVGPQIAAVHTGTPGRKTYTGYWAGASGNVDSVNGVHFSAAGQRINAASALTAYQSALANHP